jgi:hypothetical protein
MADQDKPNERRSFLKQTSSAGAASLTSLAHAPQAATAAPPTSKPEAPASTYLSLGPPSSRTIVKV